MTALTSKNIIVSARDVSRHVFVGEQRIDILRSVSLEIEKGETVAIVGPSGSGKSTLLGLLAGLDDPSEGDITLNGIDLGSLDEEGRAALRSRCVGFVFQSFQLLASLSAIENVMLPAELKGQADARNRAADLLDQVGLGHRPNNYPHQLSGGEQQRLALARAFAADPEILFADEPTGNLDTETGRRIIELLFALNQANETTLVLVSHDESLAGLCQRQIKLDAGMVV